MTSAEIRKAYIDFFVQKHGHTFVPSSPVVPHDDPTLLFTNAGMNQFKPIFLGQEKRAYTRAVNTQKCIRAGGKHNDLDDVGRSRRHHTFFEMLGNWSFGDYFKRGAIEMSWELLTKVWKLDPERLHVTCFEGDEKNGVPRDTEAANIWKEVAGLPDSHIHYFGKDNFWEMGDTGPCGPCTEIYYDRTADKSGGPLVNGEDPRVMEIWNNVFIQYNRNADRTLVELPAQHVDTGMGFERICQVLQEKGSNYDIDLFDPFWAKLKALSGHTYSGKFPKTNAADPVAEAADEQLRKDIAFRVIADHARCLTFAITDGATPSNEGRGYVLRRILRRAVRFGRQQLELREPFLHTLVPIVVDVMGEAFPELKGSAERIADIVRDEEVSFGKTLDRGILTFDFAAARGIGEQIAAKRGTTISRIVGSTWAGSEPEPSGGQVIEFADGSPPARVPRMSEAFDKFVRESGVTKLQISDADAFKLHDTYGFPIDLTRIMAEERGMTVDLAGYEKLMEQARELARSGGKDDSGKKLIELAPAVIAQLASAGVKPTDDAAKYGDEPIAARVMAIWNGDDLGLSPASAAEDEDLAIILDRTSFYAEMGGQVGDAGTLTGPTSLDLGETKHAAATVFDVATTKIVGGYVLHVGRLRSGKLAVGETVVCTVADARQSTQQNHTTTHLANWALREVLGDGVQQKGSLVDAEKLRFDFSHGKAMTDDEIARVESLVSTAIEQKLPVHIAEVPQEKALKINGLRAVFGEKYPPLVRVVSVGVPVETLIAEPANEKWRGYSVEFCGGTHLKSSDEAKAFVVTGEESVSKGIRRLVANTGDAAKAVAAAGAKIDQLLASASAASPDALPAMIADVQKAIAASSLGLLKRRSAQAKIAELQAKHKAAEKSAAKAGGVIDVAAVAQTLLAAAITQDGGAIVVSDVPTASPDQLLAIIDSLKKRQPNLAALLASVGGDRVNFVASVSDEWIKRGLKAGDWVKAAATVTGGGGGGRPNLAQAGGKDASKLPEAIEAAKTFAAGK